MDPHGHIYELVKKDEERSEEEREDVARLDGYLRARAEADAPNREARRKAAKKAKRKHGRQ